MNSTGTPRPEGPSATGTVLLAEDHWTEKDSPVTRVCEEAVAGHRAAVRSVAHYSHGALDFVVRRDGVPPLKGPHGTPSSDLAAEALPGRHLVVCAEDLNRSLQRLGTGELMRLVVGTPAGGMYCGRIRGGQHLTGVALSADGVVELDKALNDAVRTIRTEVHHLPDELLGGNPDARPAEPEGVTAAHFEVDLADRGPEEEARLRGLWHRHVNPVDLQYGAYYDEWSMVCAGDAFDDPRLGVRLMDTPSRDRRHMYRDLAARLRSDITRLRQALRPVADGPVDRLVLDVQEGAIYVLWPGRGSGTFLLGVTTDQHQVATAEEGLRSLLSALRTAPPRP